MAEKQILVKVPRTTNGINPLIVGGVPVYKEVVLPMAAKAPLEKINEKLPEHLKKVITDYVEQKPVTGPVTATPPKPVANEKN